LIILDSSVVVAHMNRRDPDHEQVADWLDENDEALITTPLAVAEMDHLVNRYAGSDAAESLWKTFELSTYRVDWFPSAIYRTIEVARQNRQLDIGLADASLVVLAQHLETIRIATLDERHFRRLRPLTGEPAFTLLPADLA
jgi:predicted nucleic acid-binding protein